MDRQAFKQRMQNLKSYRENNPGKGYWDWKVEAFADGGEVGDPEKERFYQATGRSSSGRPLEEGLKPVFSLEDAANMTPIGDAISAKDAYDAVKNRDWLGAGLAASAMIPFIPNVYRSLKSKISRRFLLLLEVFKDRWTLMILDEIQKIIIEDEYQKNILISVIEHMNY